MSFRQRYTTRRIAANQRGYSLIDFLMAIAMVGLLSSAAVSNMKTLNDPLADAAFTVTHYLRLTRGQAISRTLSVIVAPASTTRLEAATADSCSGTQTPVSNLVLDLPNGATLTDTTWSICFSPRGLSDAHVTFDLQRRDSATRTIEVSLAGGSRIQ